MKTPSDLASLQKQYDQMLKVAKQSFNNNVDLSPAFERELTQLTKVIKSMGGRVWLHLHSRHGKNLTTPWQG